MSRFLGQFSPHLYRPCGLWRGRGKDNSASAHLHLGLALNAEQKAGSEEELSKAYALAPDEPGMALTVGKAMADAGYDAQAVPILEHAAALDGNSIVARYQLSLVLQRADRVKDAIELLKQVVEAEPKNADALTNLGMAFAQMHEAADGIPYLKRAVALTPKNATTHQDLAAAYIQVNQIDEAIVELKTAIGLFIFLIWEIPGPRPGRLTRLGRGGGRGLDGGEHCTGPPQRDKKQEDPLVGKDPRDLCSGAVNTLAFYMRDIHLF